MSDTRRIEEREIGRGALDHYGDRIGSEYAVSIFDRLGGRSNSRRAHNDAAGEGRGLNGRSRSRDRNMYAQPHGQDQTRKSSSRGDVYRRRERSRSRDRERVADSYPKRNSRDRDRDLADQQRKDGRDREEMNPNPHIPNQYLGIAPRVTRPQGALARHSRAKETDEHRIAQRAKQVRFGKNTLGYDNYIKTVKKSERERGNPDHPVTPDATRMQSKKSFESYIKMWRRQLHKWDAKEETISDLDGLVSMCSNNTLNSPHSKRQFSTERGDQVDWIIDRKVDQEDQLDFDEDDDDNEDVL